MARMLADRDSTEFHLNLARRHQRLARRYKQTGLVTSMQTAIDALVAKQTAAADKELDRQAAYDDILAADGDLDDAVRNLFNAAQVFDRENPGATTVGQLFPGGGFTSIIDEPLAQEPATAEALATKVNGLGAAHALLPHAAKLNAAATAVRTALTAMDTAVRAAKNAAADEEIAQAALRRAYEANYLSARSTLGRTLAERLFPKANRSGQSESPAPAPTA